MTSRIGVVIERSSSDIQTANVIKAVVRREGARAIDTASLVLPSGSTVEINDKVSYIQDEANLTFLSAIWNNQGSFRDESGFHHDGTRASVASDSVSSEGFYLPNIAPNTLGKFRTNYGLYFKAAGQEVTVADDPSSAHTNTSSLLDFTKQFDISIFFINLADPTDLTTHWNGTTNTHQILFAKHDGTNGIEVGLKKIGSGGSSKWVVYAKINSTELVGDGTLHGYGTEIGQIEYSASTNKARMIRVYRDHEDKVRLSLDNVTDGSNCIQTIATTSTRTSAPLYFGTNKANVDGTTTNNYDFKGIIFQTRIYCGGYLEDEDIERVLTAGAQQMTMKVSGVVWKKDDKLDKINVEVKSHAKSLLEAQITSDIISNTVGSGTTDEPATHKKNLFDAAQTIPNMLKTILFNINPDYVFRVGRSTSSSFSGQFLAEGAFLQNIEILMLMSAQNFLTFPTRTFLFEYGTGDIGTNLDSGYTFKDTEFQIYERGEDDIKIVNDIEVIGDVQKMQTTSNLGNYPASFPHTYTAATAKTPVSIQLTKGSQDSPAGTLVATSDWSYDPHTRDITIKDVSGTWSNGTHYLWMTYEYEIVKGVSTSLGGGDVQRHDRREDSTSITTYGRHSKRLYMPQLLKKGDFETFTQKYLNEYKDKIRRYVIKAPFMINCLRENLKVILSSSKVKFPDSNNNMQTTTTETVKSIEWRYPECVTIIQVGDYNYDSFDLEKLTTDSTSSLTVGAYKTRVQI